MKNFTKYIYIIIVVFVAGILKTQAQGCVAVRSVGGVCNLNGSRSNFLQKGEFQLSTSFRYFKSFRHFKGREEQPQRVENGTEVINHSSSLDITLTYALNQRLNLNLNIPLVYNDRSSLYEHGGKERHHTYSKGLGDIRLSASYWLLNPDTYKNFNLAVGLGVKSNSGNYNAQDVFYTADGSTVTKPVDQSIQPGDGGWGATFEIQGYGKLAKNLYSYGNAYYLLNPRQTNGTVTGRAGTEAIMSVPDQYMARLGFTYVIPAIHGLAASLGGRYEGIPVYDITGGSEGFRRPGKIASVEPGISYMKGKSTFSLNVPVALFRQRTQSVGDKQKELATGKITNGDAAFADYLINVNFVHRFGK
jgi:hypothetical protein